MQSHLAVRRVKPHREPPRVATVGALGAPLSLQIMARRKRSWTGPALNPPGRQEPPSPADSLGGAARSCSCCSRPSRGLCLCACDKSYSYIAARFYKTQQSSPFKSLHIFLGIKGERGRLSNLIGEQDCTASVGRRGQGSMGV